MDQCRQQSSVSRSALFFQLGVNGSLSNAFTCFQWNLGRKVLILVVVVVVVLVELMMGGQSTTHSLPNFPLKADFTFFRVNSNGDFTSGK
mmetsp:Transcript_24859/g.57104  ORF Transcript_24859/g.57104 Transcript_24859/m.57104 type:complete len:90 (-) Transcript_24859:236-505(-)